MKKSTRNVLIIIMAFISVVALFISMDKVNMENVSTNSHAARIIINFYKSLPNLNISHFFIFIFMLYFYLKNYFDGKKIKKTIVFLAIFFSLCLIFGYSFYRTNSWDLVFEGEIQLIKSLIKGIGYYFIIYILIKKLYDFLEYVSIKEYRDNKYLSFIFEKHPKICITCILLIVWLPIIIIFFPGVIAPDGGTQIRQLLGEYQSVHVILINPEVTINNHHPILSTLIIGLFINIGKLINNVDLGIYLYVLVQLAFLIYVILYSFKIMDKMKIPNSLKIIALIFYAICPFYLIFSLNVLKDVLFAIALFYYILLLIEVLIDKEILKKNYYLIKLMITMFLVMMLRNNGVYTILLSFTFLLIVIKEYRKRILIALLVPLILYIGINKILYPILQIAPGSIKEMLSIPFQQTARTLNEGKEYEEEDLRIINEVLDVEAIKEKYNPILSDPVKNTFNKNASTKQLLNYFGVWFKYLLKYPTTYIEATLNNCYAYLYPNKSNLIGYFKTQEEFVQENPLEMNYLSNFQNIRNILEEGSKTVMKAPITGTIVSPGFCNWILLILALYTLLPKNKKYIIVYAALISILFVCIASPYFAMRYMLSTAYCLPILFMLSIYIAKENKQYLSKENK